jgi:hypothetical protein
LNAQIDFLNEQLAMREHQVSQSSDASIALEALKREFDHL